MSELFSAVPRDEATTTTKNAKSCAENWFNDPDLIATAEELMIQVHGVLMINNDSVIYAVTDCSEEPFRPCVLKQVPSVEGLSYEEVYLTKLEECHGSAGTHFICMIDSHARNGKAYILLERADCDLQQYFAERFPHPARVPEEMSEREEVAKAMTRDILAAIQENDATGIVHCDVKPENIFKVSRENDRPRWILADFGGSTAPEWCPGLMSATSGFCAVPLAAALFRSEKDESVVKTWKKELDEKLVDYVFTIDHQVDIFSLGCSVFWLLTGSLPFGTDCFVDFEAFFSRVQLSKYTMTNPEIWDLVSDECKSFVNLSTSMFAAADSSRSLLTDLIAHEWLHAM